MYADPPYLGCALKLYGDPTYDDPAAHGALMERMDAEADAWALSLHEPSLRTILAMAPDGVRVGAWVKPFASFKPGVDPAYTWEPIVYRTARAWSRKQQTCRDHVSHPIQLRAGLTGAKPEGFWFWLFEVLGAAPGDEFVDMFPGTGGGSSAWEAWTADSGAKHTVTRRARQLGLGLGGDAA